MPTAAQPFIRILPLIIRLLPGVRELPIPRGVAIPLMDVEPTSDELLERALKQNIRVRRKRRPTKDESLVITVDKAIACVEKVFSSGKFQKLGLLASMSILQGAKKTGHNDLAEACAECFRDHTLTQKNPRRSFKTDEELWKRPCRGHGHGNIGNLRRGNT
jgi:hypothetical protein